MHKSAAKKQRRNSQEIGIFLERAPKLMMCTPALYVSQPTYYSKTHTKNRDIFEKHKDINTKNKCNHTLQHPLAAVTQTSTQSMPYLYFSLLLYLYFFCFLSAASLFSFLPLIYFLLHLPYTSSSFLSHLLSEMLGAEGWALGRTYTKAPHAEIQHTHIHTNALRELPTNLTNMYYCPGFMSLKKNRRPSIN